MRPVNFLNKFLFIIDERSNLHPKTKLKDIVYTIQSCYLNVCFERIALLQSIILLPVIQLYADCTPRE